MQNKDRENKNNTLLLTVIGIATLLVAVIGATFAYFTAEITGNDATETIMVGAGLLEIKYENDTANIYTAEDIVPLVPTTELPYGAPIITKAFSITGSNDTIALMPYSISLIVTENSFTDGALTYSLVSRNNASNGVVADEVTIGDITSGDSVIPFTATGGLVINDGTNAPYFDGIVNNGTHEYILYIYFTDTGVNQDENKGASFKAYIKTAVDQIQTTTAP